MCLWFCVSAELRFLAWPVSIPEVGLLSYKHTTEPALLQRLHLGPFGLFLAQHVTLRMQMYADTTKNAWKAPPNLSLCASLPTINKSAKHITAAGFIVSPDLLFLLLLLNPLTLVSPDISNGFTEL